MATNHAPPFVRAEEWHATNDHQRSIRSRDSYIVFFFHETSVDDVGALVRVSPIVSLSKVYVMRNTYAHTECAGGVHGCGSLASHTYVTSRYLGYRASELSMRIWDRPQLRTCSPEALPRATLRSPGRDSCVRRCSPALSFSTHRQADVVTESASFVHSHPSPSERLRDVADQT